jgi:hypothetical protein
MEQLVTLLLDKPELAREFPIPCCLWGLVEREDDEAFSAASSSTALTIAPTHRPSASFHRDFVNRPALN